MEQRDRELLERGVTALETMVSGPQVEWEPGLPICPSCGDFNPSVTLPANERMSGKLGEVMFEMECDGCGEEIVLVVESYSMHQSPETARTELLHRKESYDGNANGSGDFAT